MQEGNGENQVGMRKLGEELERVQWLFAQFEGHDDKRRVYTEVTCGETTQGCHVLGSSVGGCMCEEAAHKKAVQGGCKTTARKEKCCRCGDIV